MELWVDKYIPKTVDDYVFQDNDLKELIHGYIKQGSTDNLFLFGPPGVGKSSLGEVLMNELKIDEADQLRRNAAKMGVDDIREEVNQFIMSGGWGTTYKYVILEEVDGLTAQGQDVLKQDMEDHSDTVRWILTTNKISKVIKPIRDRCICIGLKSPDQDAYITRLLDILVAENIAIDETNLGVLDLVMKNNYPSLRGGIRELQRYCITGILKAPEKSTKNNALFEEAYKMFQNKSIRKARELLCKNLTKEEIEGAYIWMYQNMDMFTDKDQSILAINEGLKAHATVACQEINLSATLTQLALINE